MLKKIYKRLTQHPDVIIEKAIKAHEKYRLAKQKKRYLSMLFWGRKANIYSTKYNLELYAEFGKNLKIWHQGIVLNSNAKIGNNVVFHGNNCVGEKYGKAPIIGDNVDIGYGTTIIGDINIANNIIIGANSLVNKNFKEESVVIAGCPAKVIKRI